MQASFLDIDAFPAELAELYCHVKALRGRNRNEMLALCERLAERSQREQRLVRAAQEAVDQLRLELINVCFDRDCTRLERDALRAKLKRRS